MKKLPKFKTVFIRRIAFTHPKLAALIRWCTRFEHEGLTPPHPDGTHGNLSFRASKLGCSFVITTSGLKFKTGLSANSFFWVKNFDLNKKIVRGTGLHAPSSETLLHGAIYRKRPDVGAVFHGHCGVILRQASKNGWIHTRRSSPYGSVRLVRDVLEILNKHNFLILKDHGFIAMGSQMSRAGRLTLGQLRASMRSKPVMGKKIRRRVKTTPAAELKSLT